MIAALRRWHEHWSFWGPYAAVTLVLMLLGAWHVVITLVLAEAIMFGGPGVLELLQHRLERRR